MKLIRERIAAKHAGEIDAIYRIARNRFIRFIVTGTGRL